jgi:drug/metabolite transporter (DMT)-like permease
MTKLANAALFGNCASFAFVAWGVWLARRWPTRLQGGALVLAAAGCGLLVASSADLSLRNVRGDLLALAAGLLYAGYLILVERARTELKPLQVLIVATAIGAMLLLPISLALLVGLTLLTQPALAALIGSLFYEESLSALDWAGAIAIAAALVLVQLPQKGLQDEAGHSS